MKRHIFLVFIFMSALSILYPSQHAQAQPVASDFVSFDDGVANNDSQGYERPESIDIDNEGNVYVRLFGSNFTWKLRIVRPNGTLSDSFNFSANGIAFFEEGGDKYLYVTIGIGNMTDGIAKFPIIRNTDGYLELVATDGTFVGGFGNDPRAITSDSYGNVFLTYSATCDNPSLGQCGKISMVEPSSNPQIILPTSIVSQFHWIALDSLQNIYVVDSDNNIYRVSKKADGAYDQYLKMFINKFNTGSILRGLVFDDHDNLYFIDGNSVLKRNAETGVITTFAGGADNLITSLQTPYDLAFYGGDLYIADYDGHRIKKISYICDDGNRCTDDSYDAGTSSCINSPIPGLTVGACQRPAFNSSTNSCEAVADEALNSSPCNDGNACTQTDTCQAGVCVSGAPVVCTAKDNCHDIGVCNPESGVCSDPQKTNGVSCDDATKCNGDEKCMNGACVAGAPVVCMAVDDCHELGVCDAEGNCPATTSAKADDSSCNDDDLCTENDQCVSGACAGSAKDCNDSDPCTDDSCDPAVGCRHVDNGSCVAGGEGGDAAAGGGGAQDGSSVDTGTGPNGTDTSEIGGTGDVGDTGESGGPVLDPSTAGKAGGGKGGCGCRVCGTR